MGIQTHFDKFHDKIKLGREDNAYKKARDRDDSIKAEMKTRVQRGELSGRCGLHPRLVEDAHGDCADLGRLRHRPGAGDRRGKGTGEPGYAEEEGARRPRGPGLQEREDQEAVRDRGLRERQRSHRLHHL